MNNTQQPAYWGILPANVRYAKINPMAKILFSEISALQNKNGYCTATNGYFAELYDVNKTAVSNWIKALLDAGFIKSDYENGPRRLWTAEQRGFTENEEGSQRMKGGFTENEGRGSQRMNHNNTSNNKTRINKEKKKSIKEKPAHASPEYLKQPEVIEELKKKYPKVKVEIELEKIENYLEYSGNKKKYKDFLRFAYNWMRRATEKIEEKEQRQLRYENEKNPDKPVYRMRKREAPKPTPPPPTPEEWAMIEAHAKKLGYGKLEKESKEDKDKQTSQRPKSGLARANERLREARQAARQRAFEGWVA